MAITYNPRIVTDGLVLCLDAGNVKSYPGSGTTWTDLSGNGNNGSLVNMDGTNLSSANGGSLTFDGTNEYVTTPITTTYQNFTLGCWFYNTSSSKAFRTLISKNSYFAIATNDWPVRVGINSTGNQLSFTITSGTSFSVTDSTTGTILTTPLDSLNRWFYVSATYNQSVVNLYLNGSLVATANNTISLPNNTGRVYTIGRTAFEHSGGVGDSQYNGNISQVSIYNKALTAAEVQQNFNATRSRYGI